MFECQLDFNFDTGSSFLSSIISQSSLASSRRLPLTQGHCEKLSETPLGEALVRIALKEIANRAIISSDEADEDKRELPFETMNYGKKKRQLPFETLNYGKRTLLTGNRHQKCDCSDYKRESGLPFDSILLGKKSLPFETLNYGKRNENYKQERADIIPIDGYIMGKRTDA